MYDTILCLWHLPQCTIQSCACDIFLCVRYYLEFTTLYNINLGATTTMTLSIRGVTILIYLVSSTMDSIRQSVVLFKPVPIWTSDPKSDFL